MPLSKNKDKERKRNARLVQPKSLVVQPKQGITGVMPGLSLVGKLVDKQWRSRLERIHQSLKGANVLSGVRLGISGPTFDIVGDLLEITE